MRILGIVKAEDLQPGILVGPDSGCTVAAPTERDTHGGVVIHTADSDILTQLPCTVKAGLSVSLDELTAALIQAREQHQPTAPIVTAIGYIIESLLAMENAQTGTIPSS